MSGTYRTQRRVVYRKKIKIEPPKDQKQPKPKRHLFKKSVGFTVKLIVSLILIGVITGSMVVGSLIFYVAKFQNPKSVDLSVTKQNYSSVIYAYDGSGQAVPLQKLYNNQRKIWVDLKDIPENLQYAFVCTEDQRFFDHDGVDWKRTFSAFANCFLHFYSSRQGGSTITQQLVKNVEGINTKKYQGKIQEILAALYTEKKYSKDDILQSYLNTIALGENCNGVEAASLYYFNKHASQLDLTECAALASITKWPTYYDPLLHPDHNATRRQYVLQNMLEQGRITQQQYDQAVNEPLQLSSTRYVFNKSSVQSYFVDQVIRDVINDLVSEKKYSRADAQAKVYDGGLKIYSTEDPSVQKIVDSVYTNPNNFVLQGGKNPAQSAMDIVDYTGRTIAMAGGIGQKTTSMSLNRVTQSKRQPGSSIKPLAVYGPALEYNLINWSTRIKDAPIDTSINGSYKSWPSNDDNRYLYYPISIVQALAESKNTVAVRVMQMLGPKRSFDFLTQKVGFTTLVKSKTVKGHTYSDVNLGLAIGAVTDGVTPEEMAGGYEIYGNGGTFYKPYTYTQVVDSNGNVILQNNSAGVRAVHSDTAFVMNKLLQEDVLRDDGTAKYAALDNMPVGAKTGTTDDKKDRWFVGETPYYVGAVWFGYDTPKTVDYGGTNPALQVWKNVMAQVSAKQKSKDFPTDGSVVSTDSGWYRKSNTP